MTLSTSTVPTDMTIQVFDKQQRLYHAMCTGYVCLFILFSPDSRKQISAHCRVNMIIEKSSYLLMLSFRGTKGKTCFINE